MSTSDKNSDTTLGISRLREIVAQLRDPQEGCPWDLQQTHRSLIQHLIEETFEAVEAIESEDPVEMEQELGDVLLQVVLHAQIAAEAGTFNFDSIVDSITTKLITRHPHIFSEQVQLSTQEVEQQWERIKGMQPLGMGLPRALPPLQKATKVIKQIKRRQLKVRRRPVKNSPCSETELGESLLGLIQHAVALDLDPFLALQGALHSLIKEANHA